MLHIVIISSNNIVAQESNAVFKNIALGTTLENIVSMEGLPDLIYSRENRGNYSSIALIWANPSTSNSELFEFIKNKNIQLSENISDIFNNYDQISIHYNNTNFLNYNSKMIIELNNNKLIDLSFYLKLTNREMRPNILRHFGNWYGEPERIEPFTLLWKLDNTKIVIEIISFLSNGEKEDFMTIRYSR